MPRLLKRGRKAVASLAETRMRGAATSERESDDGTLETRAAEKVRRHMIGVSSAAELTAGYAVRQAWRHRSTFARGARKASQATRRAAREGVQAVKRLAHAANRNVRSAIRMAGATVGTPLVAALAGLIVITVIIASLTGWMATAKKSSLANVPAEYQEDVQRAGSICQEITPPLIAAQIEQESGWNPAATSPAGAQGIAQFMPGTWASAGRDGDGDGKADVFNPHDAIYTQGNYMCSIVASMKNYAAQGRVHGELVDLALAAYNAGIGSVLHAGGVPAFAETRQYVVRIKTLMAKYSSEVDDDDGGGKVGQLTPALVMAGDGWHVNIAATGTDEHSMPSYERFQCTWWAAIRRKQIGRPVDGYMGNGADWRASAMRLGYAVSSQPAPGDVMCFQPGVLGADRVYGHVAVVEQVNPDGSIVISQSSVGWMAVLTQTIAANQLKAASGGISFIK